MKRNEFLKESTKKRAIEVKDEDQLLSANISETMEKIKKIMGNSSDIVTRIFKSGKDGSIEIGISFIEGLVDKNFVEDFIIEALKKDIRITQLDSAIFERTDLFTIIKDFEIVGSGMKEFIDFQTLYKHLLSGDTLVFIGGYAKGMAVSSSGTEKRGVEEPTSQTVVRGPKDGFTETLRVNTSLIRRRIKDTNLWIETYQIGKRTQTDVAIAYIKDIVNDKTVDEVRTRIKRINVDAILESGNIEELIQDETYTPFPTINNTERPDTACSGLLEGHIVILVDGSPFVLLTPAVFVQFLKSSEDYYQRADVSTLVRLLRFLSLFLALLTPSAYIAVTTFHQEMLPTSLLISLAAQREGVPFPALVEALMMEVIFEILREAGLRMPRAIGSAISIVGALVLGQAAVEAGIVSASMVIVVSITAISSFVQPSFNITISIRILRFGFMILAASFGLFGIMIGMIILVGHLASLRSFGVPYLAPMAPFILSDQKDVIVRFPLWGMLSRPRLINRKDSIREDTPSPKPPNKN